MVKRTVLADLRPKLYTQHRIGIKSVTKTCCYKDKSVIKEVVCVNIQSKMLVPNNEYLASVSPKTLLIFEGNTKIKIHTDSKL